MNEIDRELLELAAKAAGVKLIQMPPGIFRNTTGARPETNVFELPTWNPLVSDGDALRLAVKLGLGVSVPLGYKRTDVVAFSDSRINAIESHKSDPYAATRRAIVRAAAEIGRNMP